MPFDNDERRLPGGRGTGERAINLPPAVLWLIGINVAVHLLRQLLGEQADQEIILQFGLVPAAYTTDSGRDLFSLLVAPVTYQFLHGGWMHLGINMLTLEHIDVATMVTRILAHTSLEETPAATARPPFQMAAHNVNRMLERNDAAKFVARAVEIAVWQQEERIRYRIMYLQDQWWMSQHIGDDYRFEPYQPGYLGWLLMTQCGIVSAV